MKHALAFFLLLVSLATYATHYELFEIRGKVGLKDGAGKILLPASFEGLGWSDGSFSVIGQVTGYKLNNQWGLVNLNKDFITKANYESLTHSEGDLVVALKKILSGETKAGCINLKGEIVIPFIYDGLRINSQEAIVFKKNAGSFKYGLIGHKNETIIPIEYEQIVALSSTKYAVENTKGQTAIFSDQGLPVTLFNIDSLSSYHKNHAIFYQGFNQGLIDREGNIIVDANYKQIMVLDDGTLSGQLPSECKILTGNNQLMNKINAEGLTNTYGTYYKFKRGNLFGVCDEQLRNVFAPQYELLNEVGNNLYLVKKNKYGLIRKNNTVTLPLVFDSLIVKNELVRAKKITSNKNQWALYDTLGKRKSTDSYEWIGDERDNYLCVKKRGYWGVINKNGEELIHCVYDSILNHINFYFAVKLKNEYGVINTHEDWLIAPQQFPITLLTENRILVTKNNVNYIKDFGGSIIYFSENQFLFKQDYMVEVMPNGAERKLDYNGRAIFEPSPIKTVKVEIVFAESEGLRGIKKDGKFGFLDKKGNLRIANRYDAIHSFKDGLAAVKLNNKWGYINTDERIIIQPGYDYVGDFANNKALVKRGKKFGLISKEGKTVLPLQYDSIYISAGNRYLLLSRTLKGIAHIDGRVIIEPKFDSITDLNNGYLIVEQEGKFGLVTEEGISTIPLIYNQLIYNKESNNYLVMKMAEWQTITAGK